MSSNFILKKKKNQNVQVSKKQETFNEKPDVLSVLTIKIIMGTLVKDSRIRIFIPVLTVKVHLYRSHNREVL